MTDIIQFQSTPPVWGATISVSAPTPPPAGFNPRPPCGERHFANHVSVFQIKVSIHAPRVGSDFCHYSNPSSRNAVSIHAPRVGSDMLPPPLVQCGSGFNPRPPCGERRGAIATLRRYGVSVSIH